VTVKRPEDLAEMLRAECGPVTARTNA